NSRPRFADFDHHEAAQPASSIQRRKSAGRETAAFGWESVPSQDRGGRAGSSFSFPPDMRERRFRRGIPPEAPCRRKSSTAGAAGIRLPQCRGEWELVTVRVCVICYVLPTYKTFSWISADYRFFVLH